MTLTPEMVEIAPCPFCGCTDVQSWSPGSVGWYVVERTKCRVRTPLIAPEDKAIEAWNARAQSQRADAEVAHLVEEVAKLLSGAPFPSARSYTKARDIVDLIDRVGGGSC